MDNSVHKQTVCRSHRKQLICNFRINFVAQIRVRRACILSLDMNTIFFERQQKERNTYAYYVGYQNKQAMIAIARNLDFMFSIHFFVFLLYLSGQEKAATRQRPLLKDSWSQNSIVGGALFTDPAISKKIEFPKKSKGHSCPDF